MSDIITTFLSLEKILRKQKTLPELAFFMAHQTKKIFSYEKAIVWSSIDDKKIELLSVSGVTQLDKFTPFYQVTAKIIARIIRTHQKESHDGSHISSWTKADFSTKIKTQWPSNSLSNHLISLIYYNKKTAIGGMLLSVDKPLTDDQRQWLEWVIDPYQYSWCYVSKTSGLLRRLSSMFFRKKRLIILLGILALCLSLIRLPLSIVAPAVIIPKDPIIVSAPMEGVISRINVKPSDFVAKDQLLFEMDKQDLSNAKELAQKELDTAQAKYLRAIQSSFKNVKERAEINVLKAQAREKALALQYTSSLVGRADVKATRSGIVIIDDPERWTGKPVITGEKILEIAQPNALQIEIWLPAADDVYFKKGDLVKVFLNARPLASINARISYTNVDAEMTSDNVLAYRIIANIEPNQELPEIGSQGSAKLISKNKVSLFYYLFRKPISTIRQTMGW